MPAEHIHNTVLSAPLVEQELNKLRHIKLPSMIKTTIKTLLPSHGIGPGGGVLVEQRTAAVCCTGTVYSCTSYDLRLVQLYNVCTTLVASEFLFCLFR